MSDDAKVYEIRTVADFDRVPDESIEACLIDFASYIAYRRLLSLVLDASVVQVTDTFRWKDDGVAGVSGVRLLDHDDNVIATTEPEPAATGGTE